jgi:hypothetical protein
LNPADNELFATMIGNFMMALLLERSNGARPGGSLIRRWNDKTNKCAQQYGLAQ